MAMKARFAVILVVAVFAGPACQVALGYWSGSGATGDGAAAATRLNQGAKPTVEATSSTTVAVSWAAGGLSNGVPADGHIVKRYDAETGTQAPIGAACSGAVAAVTCTESNLPQGNWEYTVTPLFAANWRGPESARSAVVNTGPAYRAVELGEAAGFAVLAATTVTSAEVSAITGNLGVSPGTAMTGFRPPGTVSGTMDSADPASNKAQADLGLAYADAAERSPATLNSGSLGGQTLTRGVYKAATFTINGELTLDGRDDPSAVFIFQAGSTLGTGALSRVNLINGAQACNVFWQVGSSATLGASSAFAGSILAFTSISMGEKVTMDGRALAHNGAVTLIEDTISTPHCAPAASPAAVGPTAFSLPKLNSGPSGGSVSYTDGVVNSTSVPITTVNGSDGASGINIATTTIKRDIAPLTTATETCGTFPGTYATTVTLVGGADTSVAGGNCYRYEYIVSDKVGNQAVYTSASVAKVDTSGPQVTAIESRQGSGSSGNGQLEVGDKLILSFNQSLATASIPTSVTGATEAKPLLGNVTLTIPGITKGALDTGSAGYVLLPLSTATFAAAVVLVDNGTATTVTVTVTGISGGTPVGSSGSMVFAPAASITDDGGNTASVGLTTSANFKLF
jgi:hypothetical protein